MTLKPEKKHQWAREEGLKGLGLGSYFSEMLTDFLKKVIFYESLLKMVLTTITFLHMMSNSKNVTYSTYNIYYE